MAIDGDIVLFPIGLPTDRGPFCFFKLVFLTVTNLVVWFLFIHHVIYLPDIFNVLLTFVKYVWLITSGIAALCIISSSTSIGDAVLKLWRTTHVMVYYMIAIRVLIRSNYLLILYLTGKGKEDFVDLYIFTIQFTVFLFALCMNKLAVTRRFLLLFSAACAAYYIAVSCLTIGINLV
jgi:hypothetical protein